MTQCGARAAGAVGMKAGEWARRAGWISPSLRLGGGDRAPDLERGGVGRVELIAVPCIAKETLDAIEGTVDWRLVIAADRPGAKSPRSDRTANLLRRALLGTYQAAARMKHLQAYLWE